MKKARSGNCQKTARALRMLFDCFYFLTLHCLSYNFILGCQVPFSQISSIFFDGSSTWPCNASYSLLRSFYRLEGTHLVADIASFLSKPGAFRVPCHVPIPRVGTFRASFLGFRMSPLFHLSNNI